MMIRTFGLLAAGVLLLCGPAGASESPPACRVGAYEMADASKLVVTPSDGSNLRWRRLDGATGKLFPTGEGRYEGGEGWAVREPVTRRVTFGACATGDIQLAQDGASALTGRRIDQPTIPISFASGGQTLYGELVLPVGGRPRAVVVLQYGSGRDSAVANNYVQHLLPLKDIAVFVFDKRGTGRSTGRYSAAFGELADDMVAAVAAVRARPELRGVPLGLMGESQGGWVAPLAATRTAVDFVVASYGLAISPAEEDREEVAQGLRAGGYDAAAVAKALSLHDAAMRVANSRFREGLEDFQQLQATFGQEPWFAGLGGDITGALAATPREKIGEVRALLDFPYELEYAPEPVLAQVKTPMLWVLAGRDTEAPHETTLAILRRLQSQDRPIDIALFPNAEHGMIEQAMGAEGPRDLGRQSPGYFDLLADWITSRRLAGPYGAAVLYPRT